MSPDTFLPVPPLSLRMRVGNIKKGSGAETREGGEERSGGEEGEGGKQGRKDEGRRH